jgi:26S proteasome regulatory subunit T2
MTLSDDVNLEEFVMAKDELSGADIKAVCTEAGLLALRERRMRVTQVGPTACRDSLYSSTLLQVPTSELFQRMQL